MSSEGKEAKMDSKGGSWQQSGGLLQPPWLLRRIASPWPTTSKTRDGGLAQLGERLPCKQEVTGSIPVLSTKKRNRSKAQRSGFDSERRNKDTVEF